MAPVTTIAEIGKHEGQTVTIRGWLYNLRESGKLLFPIFRDGSGVNQGVVPKITVPPDFFDERGFTLTDPPILTPAACEGTTTLFPVDYFEEQAYLTQSGQLYIEATAMALGKVYSFGPTFRAEKSKTRRHLTEFWMVEPEVAYAQLDDIMELAENFISHVVQTVVANRRDDLKTLERDVTKLEHIKAPFPRVSYDDAVKLLQEGHSKGQVESRFEWGGDFGSPDETYISSQFDKPVMIHRYPAQVKAFYMEPDAQRPDLALAFGG